MLKGFTRKFSPLELLSQEEVQAIHRGALYTLEKTGMRIDHDRSLSLFANNDCQVDFEAKRVRIPASIVEECLRKCPSSFLMKARDRKLDLMVGGNTLYFDQGMGMRYVDLDTWETRPASAEEHKEAMIVADALEHVHLADGVFFYMERQSIPPAMVMLENLVSGLKYSSKAEMFGNQLDCEVFAIMVAQELGINLLAELEAASPLTIYREPAEAAFRYIEADFPIVATVAMAMGGEAPATNASAIVLTTAMAMAWVVLAQLIKPGSAVAVGHSSLPMNMKDGLSRVGAVGFSFTTAMMNQLLRKYQIPSATSAGFSSSSKKIDFQCGYEKALGTLISTLSGSNMHVFQGGSGGELLYHPVLSILDEDIAGWVGRFLEGTTVTDETLAIDLINHVGPIPGHFLGTAHTREWWQKEQFIPKVADLEAYPVWVKSGKKDALALAKERMEEILSTHKPLPLTPDQEQSIEDVLKDARTYYRDKNLISDEEWTDYMKVIN
jgi:trimethylamine--corrinoid protein Co-methyltransferase